MDGQKQRQALTAAERSIRLLGEADATGARRASARAVELDQIGVYGALSDAVERAASELGEDGFVSASSWDHLAAAVGQGPLAGLIAELRSGG